MIYWHVERRSLCLHSQLKSPSSSEVASMIEGVMRHCTELEVDRQALPTPRTALTVESVAAVAPGQQKLLVQLDGVVAVEENTGLGKPFWVTKPVLRGR